MVVEDMTATSQTLGTSTRATVVAEATATEATTAGEVGTAHPRATIMVRTKHPYTGHNNTARSHVREPQYAPSKAARYVGVASTV